MSSLLTSKIGSPRTRLVGVILVLLGGLVCLGRVYAARHKFEASAGIDFRAVYASSRCVISGCRPYYFADLREQFLRQGGTTAEAMTSSIGPFRPYYVGYPPPTLFYMVPFALLRWPVALFVFVGVALLFYIVAVLLYSDLCSGYASLAASACLGLFLAVQGKIVMLAQPTLLVAALLCIAVWCFIKHRFIWVGILCFTLSLLLKPPLGGLFLLYFVFSTPVHRRRAWQVIGLSAVLCLPALLWFATHSATRNWVQDYRANLFGISTPGNLSDPGPRQQGENEIIDLQAIVSLYRDDPSFYNHNVWGFSAIVIMIWLYPVIRLRPSQEKDILCIAAIAAFSMLPIYHRVYDTRALLILFPAVALLLRRTVWWGRIATAITVLFSLLLSDWYSSHSHPTGPLIQSFAKHRLVQITLGHAAPLVLLAVTIFYLAVLYACPESLKLASEKASYVIPDLSRAPVQG